VSFTGADERGTIATAIWKPPAHPELDVVDAACATWLAFSSFVTRATCAGVVNAVVFGAP
jgi:hypothetical protein